MTDKIINDNYKGILMGGLFGIVSKEDCVHDLFYGTDYHSHLGTTRGGLAVKNSKRFEKSIHSLENNYFRTKLEPDLPRFNGNNGIGVISDYDDQPLITGSHLGKFGIVTVGRINNLDKLVKEEFDKRTCFSDMGGGNINQTALVATLIQQQESFEKGIESVQSLIEGSCSLLLLTEKGIYAARDKLGRTPVIIGKKGGSYAATSETCAFPNLGFQIDKYLGPGEIVFMTPDGYEQIKKPGDKMQVCSFLWVYYGFPSSSYEGINVEYIRYNCGAALAKNDDVKIDYVAGIPDSGTAHALGYAEESRVPIRRPFDKYTPTWARSFMPQEQRIRNLVAKMKIIPNKDIISGKKILFCDDSIVRGTQLEDNVQVLFDYRARKVHMRVACPPLIYPCEFLNFSVSRTTLDLAARKEIKIIEGSDDKDLGEYAKAGSEKNLQMIKRIGERKKLTSLKYQKMENLVEAIGLPKEKLCTHCWDGTSYF